MEGINLLITRETDYAIRIIRALSKGNLMTTGDICQQELLPQHFVYKILKKLERAKIIQISRGVDGGCQLIADLKKVSLYDLAQIVESKKYISACMQPEFDCLWQQKSDSLCTVHNHLRQIQDVLDREMQNHSLYQMLCEN